MKQEVVINKVLRDLKALYLIPDDVTVHFRPFLNAIYVAGWEESRYKKPGKPVFQYNHRGECIHTYKDIHTACIQSKYKEPYIYKLLSTKKMSKRRHYFRYKKDAEEFTPAPPQSNPPNQPKTIFTC